MVNERIQALAPDLTRAAPRSARAPLGPYRAIAARAVDKCRAELAGALERIITTVRWTAHFSHSLGLMLLSSNNSSRQVRATRKSSAGSQKSRAFTTPDVLPCGADCFDLIR